MRSATIRRRSETLAETKSCRSSGGEWTGKRLLCPSTRHRPGWLQHSTAGCRAPGRAPAIAGRARPRAWVRGAREWVIGWPVVTSTDSIRVSRPSMAAMPSASIAHIAYAATPSVRPSARTPSAVSAMSRGAPSPRARSASRTTTGSAHAPPTQPETLPSARTTAFAPGLADVGRSHLTTVASTNGSCRRRSSTTREKRSSVTATSQYFHFVAEGA